MKDSNTNPFTNANARKELKTMNMTTINNAKESRTMNMTTINNAKESRTMNMTTINNAKESETMKEKDYAGLRRYAEYTFTNEDKATLATCLSKYKYKDLAMQQKNMAATYAVDKLLTEAGIEHSKPNLKFGKIKIGKFTYVVRATARCVHFVKGYYSQNVGVGIKTSKCDRIIFVSLYSRSSSDFNSAIFVGEMDRLAFLEQASYQTVGEVFRNDSGREIHPPKDGGYSITAREINSWFYENFSKREGGLRVCPQL